MNTLPFQPPTAYARLGWHATRSKILCDTSLAPWFKAGQECCLATVNTTLHRWELRARSGQSAERVAVAGTAQVFVVWDWQNQAHGFCIRPPKTATLRLGEITITRWHSFEALARHFALPEIEDVAAANPVLFEELKQRLKSLERAG